MSAGPARDGRFQILCEDNGPGIPREKLDKIFTPFSQVDNRYDRQAGGTLAPIAIPAMAPSARSSVATRGQAGCHF